MSTVVDRVVATVAAISPRGTATAVVRQTRAVVSAVARQGPAGPPGPAGAVSDLAFVTVAPIGGHRAVCMRPSGDLAYASADDPAGVETFAGITTGAAGAGAPIAVRASGEMVEPSWAWIPGTVYLGLAGALTQLEPSAGVVLVVGRALTPTRLLIDPAPPVHFAA